MWIKKATQQSNYTSLFRQEPNNLFASHNDWRTFFLFYNTSVASTILNMDIHFCQSSTSQVFFFFKKKKNSLTVDPAQSMYKPRSKIDITNKQIHLQLPVVFHQTRYHESSLALYVLMCKWVKEKNTQIFMLHTESSSSNQYMNNSPDYACLSPRASMQ